MTGLPKRIQRIVRFAVAAGVLTAAAAVPASCGEEASPEAPTTVPAELRPPGAERAGPQILSTSYSATGTSDDSPYEYGSTVIDWYEDRLGASVTRADEDAVAFRRYRRRYSGRVEAGRASIRLPGGIPVVAMTVRLENPRGSLTRVPEDFPLHPDMEENAADVPSLQQRYKPAGPANETWREKRRDQEKGIAFYRGTLGDSITEQGRRRLDYVLRFEAFQDLDGSVVIDWDGGVTLDLSRPS